MDPNGTVIDRRSYVCDRNGIVQSDAQRDFIYTRHLTTKITEAYKRDNTALPTHVAALSAWLLLRQKHPLLDEVQLALLDQEDRCFPKQVVLEKIKNVFEQISILRDVGKIHSNLPSSSDRILEIAVQRFRSFHKRNALHLNAGTVVIEGELTLYYANRLIGYGIV